MRTKSYRSRFEGIVTGIQNHIEISGGQMSSVKGWEPLTENLSKTLHVKMIGENISSVVSHVSNKNFLLSKAPEGKTFYLGDNPVCLYNARKFGAYGNLGLARLGIQIYMPLSSNLLLSAFCPSIADQLRKEKKNLKEQIQNLAILNILKGYITPSKAATYIKETVEKPEINNFLNALETGNFLTYSIKNVDFINSHQTASAARFVICQNSNFKLAQEFNKNNPELRFGQKFQFE